MFCCDDMMTRNAYQWPFSQRLIQKNSSTSIDGVEMADAVRNVALSKCSVHRSCEP
jgi:hypothetical protein